MIVVMAFAACGGPTQPPVSEKAPTTQQEFLDHFTYLHAQKFYGKQVFISEGRESWADLELEIYVKECFDSVVHIPFRVGDNSSRTWMLLLENDGRLRLRHIHLHEDGTPEDINLYGGYSAKGGSMLTQVFPADEYTCKMLERACNNEWTLQFSEDLNTLSYILKKSGEIVIQIDFDLTQAH